MVVTGGKQTANGEAQRGMEVEIELGGNRVCTEANGKESSGEKKASNAGGWRGKECEW